MLFIVQNYSKRESYALESIGSTEVDNEDRKRHKVKEIVEEIIALVKSVCIFCIN